MDNNSKFLEKIKRGILIISQVLFMEFRKQVKLKLLYFCLNNTEYMLIPQELTITIDSKKLKIILKTFSLSQFCQSDDWHIQIERC